MTCETKTKERPILFSAPMVRAILDGRKTQTRRIVRGSTPDWVFTGFANHGPFRAGFRYPSGNGSFHKCPYGVPGDRLWVRETFDIVDDPAAYHKDDGPREIVEYEGEVYECDDAVRRGPNGERWVVDYAATPPRRAMDVAGVRKWHPSIHMPRWASRITLEIESVRVERVQEISGADAVAEGVEQDSFGHYFDYRLPNRYRESVSSLMTARGSFVSLWLSINGKDSWELNPWVWVLTFKRVAS